MIFGVIVAAGTGSRMGSSVPKQFLKLDGRSILSFAVEKFLGIAEFEKVIVATGKEWVAETEKLLRSEIVNTDRLAVVAGGKRRNDTIMECISYIEKNYGKENYRENCEENYGEKNGLLEDSILVTHDGVRPFVTEAMIRDNIRLLGEYQACETVIPATDTILLSPDGKTVFDIPERSTVYHSQTPQSFRAEAFRDIYGSLTEEEKDAVTDAIKPFVMKGIKVGITMGEQDNIKITYHKDLSVAESIIRESGLR